MLECPVLPGRTLTTVGIGRQTTSIAAEFTRSAATQSPSYDAPDPLPSLLLASRHMPIGTILLILLILLLLGAIPSWPHSRSWGYGPSGGLGLIVVIVLILVLMRVI